MGTKTNAVTPTYTPREILQAMKDAGLTLPQYAAVIDALLAQRKQA